jgi:hypothetical protein
VNFPPCEADDITAFKTDSTWSLDNGSTKCNTSDPQVIETGTWSFTSDQMQLNYTRNLSGFSQTLNWKIEQLDDQVFIYSYFYYASPTYYRVIKVH